MGIAPIGADIGCAAVPVQAGLFGVQCRALPGSGGPQFRSFSVNGGGGDTITNFAPAAMRADGGAGNDILKGGSFGDILRDSSGSDTPRGNGGQDDLNTESNAAGGGKDLLDGGAELDILKAGPEVDPLLGGSGNDRLARNDLFGVPVQDGSIDKLDGFDGFDGTGYCRLPFVEPDTTFGCEIIDKD